MKQLIELNTEARKKIAKHFGVTPQNVSQALRFRRNSKNAIAIRKMAMENGGVLYERSKISK